MGLPRSSLVKSKSANVAPVTVPRPVPVAIARPVEIPAPAPSVAPPAIAKPIAIPAPLEFAPTMLAPAPAPADVAPVFAPAVVREPMRTKADSLEIEVLSDSPPAPALPMRMTYASAPSSSELLERAAARGPARMTWESIVLPTDPILDEKRQPHVAERRARLTRVVKATLGVCVAVCVLALGVSALAADSSSASSGASAAPSTASAGKALPSQGVVPVEPLAHPKHAKARRAAPMVATAAIVRTKRR